MALIVAAFALSACSSNSGAEQLPVGPVAQNPRPEQVVLPFEAYQPSPAERASIETAEDLLTRDCMRARGFTFDVPVRNGSQPRAVMRRYGVIEIDVATKFGFHLPRDPEAERLLAIQQHATFSPREQQALNGTPDAPGCFSSAQRQLGGPSEAQLAELARYDAEAFSRAEADSRTQAAFRKWKECMTRFGYSSYRRPQDAVEDTKWNLDSETPSADEIRVAVQDVRCKQSSNLVGIWLAVDTAEQLKIIDDHPGLFTTIKKAHEDRLRAAAHIVG